MSEEVLLDANAMAAMRGERLLFRDINVRALSGEVILLRGANGAGKTTLLRQLAGLSQPEAGQVVRYTQHHWLGHETGLKTHETPRSHLRHWARVWGSRSDIANILEAYGLKRPADIPIRYLSAGQKRRTALGRMALETRRLWLLDEPLTALDGEGQDMFIALMRAHCDAGGAIIAAVHGPFPIAAQNEVTI